MANTDFRKDVTMPVRPRSVYTAHSYNQVFSFTTVIVYRNLMGTALCSWCFFVVVKSEFNLSRRSQTYPLFKTTASFWKVAWVRLSWVVRLVGNLHGAHHCNARLPSTQVMIFTTRTPGENLR